MGDLSHFAVRVRSRVSLVLKGKWGERHLTYLCKNTQKSKRQKRSISSVSKNVKVCKLIN